VVGGFGELGYSLDKLNAIHVAGEAELALDLAVDVLPIWHGSE
jgi:hypothetical protein